MCIFCDEINNPVLARQLMGETFQYKDRVLFSDECVLAIAGYGPQVFPYVLVLTKRHVNSFSETTITERKHVLKCLNWLVERKIFLSSKLCVFEHGGESTTGNSTIDHFHLHVIDNSLGFFENINWGDDQISFEITEENIFDKYRNYLMIGVYEKNTIHTKINISNIKEPQYFRKKLALLLKSEQWDWNVGMNNEYVSNLMDLVFKRSEK